MLKKIYIVYCFAFSLRLLSGSCIAAQTNSISSAIIVDANGKGDYRSIQAAINSLPDSSSVPITIFIKNGVYNEKIYIEKSNLILKGEDRDKTIITQDIARDEWRCNHKDDWGVAT